MSEEQKVVRSLVVAFMLVVVVFATIVIGSHNPGPSIPEYGQLTYTVDGTGEDVRYNGSLCYHFEHPGEGLFSWGVLSMEGDDGPDFNGMPINIITRSGTYMDTVTFDTIWGEKVVNRFISPRWQTDPELSAQGGIMISYCGAETDLLYHLDLVMPTYRAAYDLIDTNMTMIAWMDRQETENMDELIVDEQFQEGLLLGCESGGMVADMFMEPGDNENYELTLYASNFTMFVMSEEDVAEMVEGGLFHHGPVTVVDENNVTALLEEGRYFVHIVPTGYEDAWFYLSLDVIEEV